mgnify:CR=1 FL=1
MPVFICENKDCSNYGKKESYQRVSYKWNQETMRLEADESFCPVCGNYRNPVKEYEGWSDAWFKAESNRNYNNKKVKQYDWDRSVATDNTLEINKKLF